MQQGQDRAPTVDGAPRIDWVDEGQSHVVVLHGEFDLAVGDELERAFTRAVTSGAPEVVVDLEFCTFIDSRGVVALLGLNRRLCRRPGRDLLILPGPPQVQRVFEVCDLLEVLPFREESRPPAHQTPRIG